MIATSANVAVPTNRLDRQKARTRQALVDAAVRLIAEGRGERASVQEITGAADIGFGSFYNHFANKEQLFETASSEVLERWAQMLDRACVGISDPAEALSHSLRISARLGWTHPDVGRFITGAGLGLLDAPGGLAPRPFGTSRPAKSPGISRWAMRVSLSAQSQAASLGCYECIRAILHESTRHLSTSSLKRASGSPAFRPRKQGDWPDYPFRSRSPGRRHGEAVQRGAEDSRSDGGGNCQREGQRRPVPGDQGHHRRVRDRLPLRSGGQEDHVRPTRLIAGD